MNIPIILKPSTNIPVVPMILPKLFKNFGYYCFSMPVTSLENQIRGVKIWGLPKVVQEIDILNEKGFCQVRAYEENGDEYYRLNIPLPKNEIPIKGSNTHFDVSAYLYSMHEGQLKKSETNFKGDFFVVKKMDRLFKSGGTPDHEYLHLGNSPSGKFLQQLEIDPNPFQLRYTESMSSCFDLPLKNFQAKEF